MVKSTVHREGLRLSEFRKIKGFTQTEFADRLECSQPNLHKIESGAIGISSAMRHKLFIAFPELNPNWIDKGLGQMLSPVSNTPQLSTAGIEVDVDNTNRFLNQLEKFESFVQDGKVSHESLIMVFHDLKQIVKIQNERIKDLLADKEFLKGVIKSAKNTPFEN